MPAAPRTTTPRARSLHALEQQPAARPSGGAEERAVAYLRDLDQLLQRRPELAETYQPARLSVEALRWAV